MKSILLAAMLLFQQQSGVAPANANSRLHPQNSGPFTLDLSGPTRSAFETLGEKAGLTVVFDRDYRPLSPSITLKVQDADIAQALDSLTTATDTFWVPIGSHSILISANNVSKHRNFDLARVKLVHLGGPRTTQELFDVMNALRQGVGLSTLAALPATNMLMWKDTPEKSSAAERRLADLSSQMFGPSASIDFISTYETDAAGNVYLLDGSSRNINPRLKEIQPTVTGPFTMDVNQRTNDAIIGFAAMAGLSVMFDRDYRPTPNMLSFKLKDADIFEVLDILTVSTATFWIPLDAHTIYISENNSTKRRDNDSAIVDIVHLTATKTPQELNDVMNLLRQNLNITSIVANPGANSLLLRDSLDKVALAEEVIADIEAQLNGTKKTVTHVASFELNAMGNIDALDGGRRRLDPLNTRLQSTSTGPFSFDINGQPSRAAVESIAAKAGLSVVYDRDFRPTPPSLTFKMTNTDVYSALDKAILQLHAVWIPLGSDSIFVVDNNSTKHRDFDPLRIELIDIPNVQSPQELNDVMNAVRQTLNFISISAIPRTNSLLLRDTPAKIELAKSLIAALRSQIAANAGVAPLTSVVSIDTDSLSSQFNTPNTGLKTYSKSALTQLRPRRTGTFSLHLNDDVRHVYEILGETVGLNVTFDPKFKDGQASAFNLEDVDATKALDLLGTQTGNFWQVIDSKTVFITPDRVNNGQVYEPTVLKSFHLTQVPASEVPQIVNIIKTTFNINTIMSDDASKTIDVRTAPTQLIVLEKLLTAMDRQAP